MRERELRQEVGELKRLRGNKMLELDFFKGALQKVIKGQTHYPPDASRFL